jgi:uncharacterized 2Fe-2S/4Fe-4S cluster protein (DUF4445 family)
MDQAPTKRTTQMATVTFRPAGETIEVPAGTSVLDAAILCELDLPAPCAGQGRCGRCRVRVLEGEVERRSIAGLEAAEVATGWAVACQSYLKGAAVIEIPPRRTEKVRPHGHAVAEPQSLPLSCDWRRDPAVRTVIVDIAPPTLDDQTSDFDRLRRALAQQHGIEDIRAELPILRRLGCDLRMANWKAAVTLEMRDWVYGRYLPPRLIRVYPAAFPTADLGVAVDLGTTSVVVYLVDFAAGRIVDTASAYNKQIACGEDVISRIVYAKREGGLARLQQLAVDTINELLEELQTRNGVERHEIHEVTLAGNTTMAHLLLGLDPRYLREEPYIPTIAASPKLIAYDLGLRTNNLARVHVLPAVGSYVGGDITAGVISSGMYATDKLTLFIDIGTNGEMVLGNSEWLLSCACSAGPAFEGGGVKMGMRATAGAIEDVYVDDLTLEPTFRTIDDAAAIGICGSGLIDLLGELFVTGLLDRSGRLDRNAPTKRVRVRDGVPEYVVAWAAEGGNGHDVVLTETDVSGLIRAKAAIYAGYTILCESMGVQLADVEQILIGGAFGQYLNVQKAIRVGLLPDLPPERFKFLGNTSAVGAYMTLLCVATRHDVLDVAAKMTYLELSADNSFMDAYTSSLFLPHTDLDHFPTVRDELAQRSGGERGSTTPQEAS